MFGIETVFGINPKRFGYKRKFDNRCVILVNHRCHLDWFFLWSIIARQGDLSSWKPMMKMSLKKIPLLGWLVQFPMHIFLNRNWEADKEEVSTKLHFFNALNYPLQLLMFPDGADLTAKSKARSDAFATSHNLPKYDYLLHPHTKGFTYSVSTLKKSGLDSIVDITIAYPDVLPKTEIDFIKGRIPREIHYYIEHHSLKNLPDNEEGLAQWLQERWKEKEERLKYFYENRHFPSPASIENGHSNGIQNGNGAFGVDRGAHTNNGIHLKNGNSLASKENSDPGCYPLGTRNGLLWAVLLYLVIVGGGVYMTIFHFSFYLVTGIPGLLYMVYIGLINRGIDYHELSLHLKKISRAKSC
jgi:lysocardiolipin and lysophospholipid acyltransferase